jgi:general secretion pathway protein K
MKRSSNRRRPGGFALVIVLWSLGTLALVCTRLTATARAQLLLAAQTRDEAVAEAAADGGIRQGMFILLGGGKVPPLNASMRVRIGGAVVDIGAEDEAAKINPNSVSRDVLRGLLTALGVDPPNAARLSGQIADWRIRSQVSVLGGPKIAPYRDRGLPYRSGDHLFYSLDEVGLVADMTPDIMVRLRPWLSVYHEGEVADAGTASPAAAAIDDARASAGGGARVDLVSRNVIVRLTVTAVQGHARFSRSAVVRVRASADDGSAAGEGAFQVLTWE